MSGYTKIVEGYSEVGWGRIFTGGSGFSSVAVSQMIEVNDIFYILGRELSTRQIKFLKFYFYGDDNSTKYEELSNPSSLHDNISYNGERFIYFNGKIIAPIRYVDSNTYDLKYSIDCYDISANEWTPLSSQLPYDEGGIFGIYKGELHYILGFYNKHYILKNNQWDEINDHFPDEFSVGSVNSETSSLLEYNGVLYLTFIAIDPVSSEENGALAHWDESNLTWIIDCALPGDLDLLYKYLFNLNNHMVFYNGYDEGTEHFYDTDLLYLYNESEKTWTKIFDQSVVQPYPYLFNGSPAVIKDNMIYARNRGSGFYYLYQDAITSLKRFERACISVPTDETVKRDGVPYVKYTNKMVRKAWVWGSLTEGQPNRWLLALDSADYFVYHSRTLPSGLPYDFYGGSSVIFDGKLHILGGRNNPNKHFSFNGTIWTEESELPFNLTMDNRAVVYDEKIHVLGWKSGLDAHYSWDGTSWEQESELPYNLYGGCVATYNNKIHIIGGYDEWGYSKKHRVWDGTSWEEEVDVPYLIGQDSLCVIFNGKLRILAGSSVAPYKKDPGSAYYHYSWDDFIWARELDLDFSQPSKAVVCDNKLFIYEYNNYKSYLNLNNVWTKISKVTPYNVEGASMINYHDQINLLGGDQLRGQNVWNATENRWQEIKLPNLKDFYNGSAIIFDNKIHILGGTVDPRMHYSWDMDTDTLIWEEESRLPYDFNDGSKSGSVASVIYDDKIHIFGGRTASIRRNHYSWDGTVWTAEELLPYTGLAMGDVVIFRNQIHVLGITTPNQASSGPINIINHFKWDDHDPEHPGWLFQSKIPSNIGSNFRVVVWNDAIHIIGKTKHYSWTPETLTWKEESTLPYEQPAEAIVVGNYIRIMGSELNESEAVNCYYGKYVKDKFTWTKYDDLLVGYDSGSAVMGRILYLLSGKKSYNSDVIQTTNDGKFK